MKPSFRSLRLWQVARFSWMTAMQIQSVAIGWQIYEVTRQPMSLGIVGLAQFAPMLLLSLATGHAADRLDRRGILMACNAVLILVTLALPRAHAPVAIYGLLTVVGAARAFAGPASSALLPQLVEESYLPRAIAQSSSLLQAAMIVGPAIGGALYGFAGGAFVYPVCSALLALGLLGIALVRPRVAPRERLRSDLRTLFAGVAYVWRSKLILGAISLDMLGVLFGGAVALLPIYARDILQTGPVGLGLLRSAPAAGAALTGIWLAVRPIRGKAGSKLLVAMVVFGAATIAFGVSRHFVTALVALVVVGASDMVNMVIRMTLVQLATPDQMRGRVSAVNLVFIGASNELGELESGLTAQWIGPVASVVFGGACTVAIAVAWSRLFPAIRKVDRLEAVKP